MTKGNLPDDPALRSRLIRMAWEDRTTFEEIEETIGVSESEVIQVMRAELKPGSFRRWRKRVSGRITKHRKKFRRRSRLDPDIDDADLDGGPG
jgi:uncharacterized protein (TIGR03643 family)